MVDAMALPLFYEEPRPEVPRCRMCLLPARWLPREGIYGPYCATRACLNRNRVCQVPECGKSFIVNVDGAGTKYCSTDCKRAGYRVADARLRPTCAWCGQLYRGGSSYRSCGTWPFICSDCQDPLKHLLHRLKKHHVDHEMARRLLDDPGCGVCGRDIVSKIRQPTGKVKAVLVVDHDHMCCPGVVSCGLCVRGFLCPQCNSAAGLLADDAGRLRALADYLDRYTGGRHAAQAVSGLGRSEGRVPGVARGVAGSAGRGD